MSTMDTTGFDQVGRYGTLSLLKKRPETTPATGPSNATPGRATTPSEQQVITSFGIDSANLTFGRDQSCDVRLYYFTVDPVHCRLINEDGKAFMAVQGKAGALIDGCWVYPHTSGSSVGGSEEVQQTIVPLINNSEFEIHGKRFRFTYPPKEIRKVLINTPVAQRNRKLRLSMIQSAQVFSPRPSKDPRENLRVLQSPIKTSIFGVASATRDRSRSQSPHKPRAVSPLKFGISADDDSDEDMDDEENDENEEQRGRNQDTEEQFVLVHTNHPRVVEEDHDLVILEDVPLHLLLPSPSLYAPGTPTRPQRTAGPEGSPTPAQHVQSAPMLVAPQPQQAQPQVQPPRTPRRRPGNALHRAVLIRSAQRAVWKAEMEKEEEEEEMEVLGSVVGSDEHEDDNQPTTQYVTQDVEMEDVEMRSVSDEEEEFSDEDEEGEGEEGTDEDEDEEGNTSAENKPLWRKSLERIIPWPFSPTKKDSKELSDDESDEGAEGEENGGHEDEERDNVPETLPQQKTPARKPLGSFLTPQPQAQQPLRRNLFPSNNNETSGNEAAAPAAGSSAVAAPGPGRYSLGGGEARRVIVQQPWRVKDLVVPPLPGSNRPPVPPMGSRDPPATPRGGFDDLPPPVPASSRKVTEEERKAIQERRRSAVREVREDSFWKDGAPGMSPSKARPSPAKAATGLGVGRPSSRPSVIGTETPARPLFASPTKGRTLDFSIAEDDKEESPFLDRDLSKGKAKAETPKPSSAPVDDDDDSLDTHGLLERMRETVEDMKRRRSIVTPARLPATPVESEHSIFKLTTGATPAKPSVTPMEGEHSIFKLTGSTPRQSVKKLDFSHLAPSSSSKRKVDASASVFTPSHDVDMITSSSEAVPQNEENAEDRMEVEPEVEPEPFSLLAKTPVTRASQATVSDAAEKEAPLVPAVVVDAVEDQTEEVPQEPEVEEEVKAPARGRSRLLRAPREEPVVATQQEQTDDSEEDPQTKPKSTTRAKPPSTTRATRLRATKSPAPVEPIATELAPEPSGSGSRRRTRSRTPQPPVEQAEVEKEKEERVPRSATRRTRQTTAELEEDPAQTQTKRRGKKAAESETEEVTDSEQVKPTPARRGRKPRAVPAAIEEEEQEEVEKVPAPAPTPATVKRGRPRKKEVVAVPEEDEDGDELDSYDIGNTAAVPEPVAPAKKATKAQGIPVPKGRKKEAPAAAPVKQEDEAPPLAATRSGRGTRANAATTPAAAATKTPATAKSKIPMAAKARGRPKTPATAPAASAAASSSNDTAEKENTPGTRSGSNGSDEGAEESAAVKVRVTRRTGAAATATATRQTKSATKASKAVKTEDEEEQATAAKATRTTRVMRTRTKTG